MTRFRAFSFLTVLLAVACLLVAGSGAQAQNPYFGGYGGYYGGYGGYGVPFNRFGVYPAYGSGYFSRGGYGYMYGGRFGSYGMGYPYLGGGLGGRASVYGLGFGAQGPFVNTGYYYGGFPYYSYRGY